MSPNASADRTYTYITLSHLYSNLSIHQSFNQPTSFVTCPWLLSHGVRTRATSPGAPFQCEHADLVLFLKVLVVRGCFILLVDLVDAVRRTAARLEGGVMHS